jgi:exo-beta-1,3-glucanase (GH17 family)
MEENNTRSAQFILGNSSYLAISYGGYRKNTRSIQPTIEELKEDLRIMHAMGIRILRTYNVKLPHASNVVKAISELKKEDTQFEMYVMLGVWIDCLNAWTDLSPNHDLESPENELEVARAVTLVNQYPDIIKIIAVGNEAMVKWATSYYVQPGVILKWVNHLQQLKSQQKLPKDLWITSSDNFASWGGGDKSYHVADLERLVKAVDYISMHTYPMHDTHYNPSFWGVRSDEEDLNTEEKITKAMERSLNYSKMQYDSVKAYVKKLGVNKPIHIGETGWASASNEFYGPNGSKATDEYKQGLYYQMMRKWTNGANISCFFFEAFDEPWKDAQNPGGSENHFGLFTVDAKAKFAIWDAVDLKKFEGLNRGSNKIEKTWEGNHAQLLDSVHLPPLLLESSLIED